MNFLQICQEANRLASMQGTVSDVTVTTGYQVNLINHVVNAWVNIQNYRNDWPFMRSSGTFNTVAGTTSYTLSSEGISDLKRFAYLTYEDSNGNQVRIKKISYDEYVLRNIDQRSNSAPTVFAEDLVDRHIIYMNPPDDAYTITVHYYTEPVELSADSDIPKLPVSYHNLIAYMAAMYMCHEYGNANLYDKNRESADHMMGNLLRDHLPSKRMKVRGIA